LLELAGRVSTLVEDNNLFTIGGHGGGEVLGDGTDSGAFSDSDGLIQVIGDFIGLLVVDAALEALVKTGGVGEDHGVIAEGNDVSFPDLLARLEGGAGCVGEDIVDFDVLVAGLDVKAAPHADQVSGGTLLVVSTFGFALRKTGGAGARGGVAREALLQCNVTDVLLDWRCRGVCN